MRTSHLGLLIRIIFSYVHTLHSAAVLVSKICCFVYEQPLVDAEYRRLYTRRLLPGVYFL